jgi:hypothetical protein
MPAAGRNLPVGVWWFDHWIDGLAGCAGNIRDPGAGQGYRFNQAVRVEFPV